jgi:hypothetical protein
MLCLSGGHAAADWLGDLMPSFAESELQFQRSDRTCLFYWSRSSVRRTTTISS